MRKINTPLKDEDIELLKAGESVLLSGKVYTARDQAHKRIVELIKKRKKIPFNLCGQIIYYCGPTKTPKGKVIGSCGPTTSSRMDELSLSLISAGLKGMIGKGKRSDKVKQCIKKHKAVYFLTFAGCGAYLNKFVKKMRLVAFKDLGPEAIYELEVKDFPLIVGIDSKGRDIYKNKKG